MTRQIIIKEVPINPTVEELTVEEVLTVETSIKQTLMDLLTDRIQKATTVVDHLLTAKDHLLTLLGDLLTVELSSSMTHHPSTMV